MGFTRSGIAKYHDSHGVLREVVANELRNGHFIAGEQVRLLEDTRTNGWSFPEDLSNAVWSKVRTTIVSNDIAAPDGKMTADKVEETAAGSNTYGISRDFSAGLTDNTDTTVSVYAKADERTIIYIETVSRNNTTLRTWFNLGTGAIGTQGHTSKAWMSTTLVDDWYRCSIAFDVESGVTNDTVRINLTDADNVTNYTGVLGSGAHFWGLDVEEDQASPSSYVDGTRVVETFFDEFLPVPQEMTAYLKFIELGNSSIPASGSDVYLSKIGGSVFGGDPRWVAAFWDASGQAYGTAHDNGTTTSQAALGVAPVYGDTVELRSVLNADGSVLIGQSINEAAETTANNATAPTLQGAWADTRRYLNSSGALNQGLTGIISDKIESGTQTMAQMRALAEGDLYTFPFHRPTRDRLRRTRGGWRGSGR